MKLKSILKWLAILIFVGIISIQFIRPNRVNPPIIQAETLEANLEVPENISLIFKRSCNDCHSNETIYPWYSNIAPLSWEIVEHIEDGRKELNFSKWKTYDNRKQAKKLSEICEEIELGFMPHSQYLWLHWDAKLSEEDKKAVCQWTETAKTKIPQSE